MSLVGELESVKLNRRALIPFGCFCVLIGDRQEDRQKGKYQILEQLA